jgi:hypothetical protein
MIQLPHVVGLTLCERMTADKQHPQIGLEGLFQCLYLTEFPTPARHFTVYSTLYGGSGEGILQLTIFRSETEDVIYRYQRWLALSGPPRHLNVEIRVNGCVFPAAGRYLIDLNLDGQRLTQRFLDVVRDRR